MEQQWVREFGLTATYFLGYEDLFDERSVNDAKADSDFGDEIGLSLHKLRGPGLDNGGLNHIWLLDQEKKAETLEHILCKWRKRFNRNPVSIASYHLDAASMKLIRELSPETQIVIAGCFEEGVRNFHGCNHSWYLFNEGMPWQPWYPSKSHSLRPASDAADAVGLVAVPHLARDMALSYEGRNDFWATHPPNVIRGMGNEATWSPYDLNLIDQYLLQEDHQPFPSYLNIFVSAPWLDWNHTSEYPPQVARELYRKQLAYIRELTDKGLVDCLTMRDYNQWFRTTRTVGERSTFLAKEILYGSRKHYLWYLDPDFRVLIDCAQGGSIGDLRPYLGKVPVTTGPDSPHKSIGSYPFLIQSQLRTGARHHSFDGSRTTLKLTHQDQTIDLCDHVTRCHGIDKCDDHTVYQLEPIDLIFESGFSLKVVTRYSFFGNGRILVERELSDFSDLGTLVELEEYFKGCWGFTEYPEDMSSIRLQVSGDRPARQSFRYRGRQIETNSATSVSADVPDLNITVSLKPYSDDTSCHVVALEGHLFNPFFTLALQTTIQGPTTFRSWIILSPLKN